MQTVELRQAIDFASQIRVKIFFVNLFKAKLMNFNQKGISNLPNENFADLFNNLFDKRKTPQGSSSFKRVSNSLGKSKVIYTKIFKIKKTSKD